MRYVNGFLCLCLALFAIAQYNDPHVLLWFLIYGVPAVFAGVAALHPETLRQSRKLMAAFWACLALAALGTVYYWPTQWQNWIHIEETREGIGMMIVLVTMVAVALSLRRAPPRAGHGLSRA
jgi:peptidoglycan/LPS O-acetylase OafA/YrhL